MKTPRSLVAALFGLAASILALEARADTCPAPPDVPDVDRIAAIDAGRRLDYHAQAFDREVRDVDIWSWTWGSVYAGAVAVEGVALGLTTNYPKRIPLEVGIASTAFGAASLYGLPLKLTLPLRSARAHWGDPDRCAVLARAERTLVSVEKDQALATGILGHIGNVLVNVGIGLILGLGYDQWESAGISFGVGVAIGEANAFTQPHHLRDVLARYRSGQLDAPAPAPSVTWSILPIRTREMSGAALTVVW